MDNLIFKISGEELDKIEHWKTHHRCTYRQQKKRYEKENAFYTPCGGWMQYKYIFEPCSFTTFVTVECECGRKSKLEIG
jgi:hypothetical protein